MDRPHRKRSTSWMVLGALAGLVTVPTLVAATAVLAHDLRDFVFQDRAAAVLVVTGTAGLVIGGAAASRALRSTPRVMTLFATISGAVLGAVVLGSLFLWIEVTGPDWPHGLAAFVLGALFGTVLGGAIGGTVGHAAQGSATETSRRDAR